MCRTIRFLFGLVKWTAFRALLIRAHMEGCPRCGLGGFEREEWAGHVRCPGWVRREESLLPAIRERMKTSPRPAARPEWASGRPVVRRPVYAAAAALAGAAVLILLLWRPGSESWRGSAPAGAPGRAGLDESPRVQVLSAEI